MLCTLLKPSSGYATINGYDICEEMAAVRESIGIVFQEPAVDEELTGAEKNQNRPADSDRRLARNRRNTRRRT